MRRVGVCAPQPGGDPDPRGSCRGPAVAGPLAALSGPGADLPPATRVLFPAALIRINGPAVRGGGQVGLGASRGIRGSQRCAAPPGRSSPSSSVLGGSLGVQPGWPHVSPEGTGAQGTSRPAGAIVAPPHAALFIGGSSRARRFPGARDQSPRGGQICALHSGLPGGAGFGGPKPGLARGGLGVRVHECAQGGAAAPPQRTPWGRRSPRRGACCAGRGGPSFGGGLRAPRG